MSIKLKYSIHQADFLSGTNIAFRDNKTSDKLIFYLLNHNISSWIWIYSFDRIINPITDM